MTDQNFTEISKRETTPYNDHTDAEYTVRKGIESIKPDPQTGRREKFMLVVCEHANPKKALGFISLKHLRDRRYLGYMIDSEQQGKGYGFRAARLFLENFFNSSNENVYADVRPGNEPSLRILKKLGFTNIPGDFNRPMPFTGILAPYYPMKLTPDNFRASAKPIQPAATEHKKYAALKSLPVVKNETAKTLQPAEQKRDLSHLKM